LGLVEKPGIPWNYFSQPPLAIEITLAITSKLHRLSPHRPNGSSHFLWFDDTRSEYDWICGVAQCFLGLHI